MLTLVRIVAIGQALQGLLEFLVALIWSVMFLAPEFLESVDIEALEGLALARAFFLILALGFLVSASLRFISATQLWDFRGYVLSIVSMVLGLGVIVFFYCFPSSFFLLVLGLVALLNGTVREAFDLRRRGYSAARVRDWLAADGRESMDDRDQRDDRRSLRTRRR